MESDRQGVRNSRGTQRVLRADGRRRSEAGLIWEGAGPGPSSGSQWGGGGGQAEQSPEVGLVPRAGVGRGLA